MYCVCTYAGRNFVVLLLLFRLTIHRLIFISKYEIEYFYIEVELWYIGIHIKIEAKGNTTITLLPKQKQPTVLLNRYPRHCFIKSLNYTKKKKNIFSCVFLSVLKKHNEIKTELQIVIGYKTIRVCCCVYQNHTIVLRSAIGIPKNWGTHCHHIYCTAVYCTLYMETSVDRHLIHIICASPKPLYDQPDIFA